MDENIGAVLRKTAESLKKNNYTVHIAEDLKSAAALALELIKEGESVAFGGSQTDANFAQFSTAIAGLYAAYYPKLVTGDTKTATDLLNAIAGGIEDATASYVTTPVAESLVPQLHLGTTVSLRPFRGLLLVRARADWREPGQGVVRATLE